MKRFFAIALTCALLAQSATAAPPQTLSFQGFLASLPGGTPVNGTVQVTFRVYAALDGGTALWSEGPLSITVSNGVYSHILGNSTPLNLPFDQPYFLGVAVGSDAEMTPRTPLTSVPYAMRAGVSDRVELTSALQVATDTSTVCSPSRAGSLRWSGSAMEACDGSAWRALAVAGGGGGASHALTVARTGSGIVTSSPVGIYCGSSCATAYPDSTVVTLTATPDPGASFVGWGGGSCSGTGGCTVTMSAARSVTATFNNALSVTRTGTGSGTVTSTPAGINCGSTCGATYSQGQPVSLSAAPAASSTFEGWSGACSGVGSCPLTMDQARSVTATFAAAQFFLQVAKDGDGAGTVTSTPGGITCGATCLTAYDSGIVVSLSAISAQFSTFAGWSGACSGTGSCNVSMDGMRSVLATFTRPRYTLTAARAGPGTVFSSPTGIYCPVACSQEFIAGNLVTITPVPDSGASFGDWSGACSGSGACAVAMDGNKTLNARFGYLLAVNRTGGGGGTVSATATPPGTPNGLNCGSTCAFVYNPGAVVTLTATPDGSSTFLGWSGSGCSGTGTCSVTMSNLQSVTAVFTSP